MKLFNFAKKISIIAVPLLLTACIDEITYLDQGWNDNNKFRDLSYSTSQGSQLIPYEWFNHLRVSGSGKLIKSDEVIAKLRYLPDFFADEDKNPDRLPIGFVKDVDPETGEWLGINCAACHTGQIIVGKTAIRIDGAPAMGDYIGFLKTVRNSLRDTVADTRKMRRFARGVLAHSDQGSITRLEKKMRKSLSEINAMLARSYTAQHQPGNGRIDAFSGIRNEIFEFDLGIPSNHKGSSAPVSYPFLWGTSELERVQWAGNVDNPYGRNAGQVLGVLGRLNLTDPNKLFESSIRRDNLFRLERWLSHLEAPKWPQQYLGRLDRAAIERGKAIYKTVDNTGYSCVDCHSLKNQAGKYPLTPARDNAFGKQFVKTKIVPVSQIKTDPNAVSVVYSQTPVKTGQLAPLVGGQTEMIGANFLSLVTKYTVGTLFKQEPALTPAQQALYSGFRVYSEEYVAPPLIVGYKARPLEGIWATGPYLHNGSVPNLKQLLLPSGERRKTFWVGSQHFDTKNVGFKSTKEPYTFFYDTQLSGNSNRGHEYGTTFTRTEKADLLEFLKSL